MNTPEIITELKQNEVFVFGTNQYGEHAGGAAATARNKFGALYGCPIGLVGKTYGIITTSFNSEPITFDFILAQVKVLYQFAKTRPDLTFFVTKIGCGIAGYGIESIAALFKEYSRPENIILPKEF